MTGSASWILLARAFNAHDSVESVGESRGPLALDFAARGRLTLRAGQPEDVTAYLIRCRKLAEIRFQVEHVRRDV